LPACGHFDPDFAAIVEQRAQTERLPRGDLSKIQLATLIKPDLPFSFVASLQAILNN
jgi:hypothetical protein